jgi:hypothetical protein
MKKTISALAIAAVVAISGPSARAGVIVMDFQQALNSDQIKSAIGDDVAFYLSGATTPVVRTSFQEVIGNSSTIRWYGSGQKPCMVVLLKVLQIMRDQAKQQGGNAVVNVIGYYKKKELVNSSMIECYTGAQVQGHITLKGTVAEVER